MTGWREATTFADVWSTTVAANAGRPFLIFETPAGDTVEWSYEEFDRDVGRAATLLVSYGVEPGSPVHLALRNSPAFVAVWLAANRLGAWIIPSDPMAAVAELTDHLTRTRPVVGFCATRRAGTYRAAAGNMPVVEVDESGTGLAPFAGEVFGDWPQPHLTDRAAVMFTSGTTGRPKGVEVTQANYAFAGKIMSEAADLHGADRHLVVLPLFHANAQYYSFASAIWTGASVALMPAFSASGFLPQAARHAATCASLFAAPLRMILTRGAPEPELQLRHTWYAQNISPGQYATVSSWFGCRPRQLYGMTETIPAVLTNGPADPLPDSMGTVTAGCSVDIQDAAGNSVPAGVEGEVVVGGDPGTTLFGGYLDDPATTEAGFRNGWFLTGDRATRDRDGRHFFTGRRSDVLKVAGENVSTVEVESAIAAHPAVLEVAVVAAPDPIRDEVPIAFVVPADPADPPTPEALDQWCSERLSKAKRPRSVVVIDELPRTSVGKIRKFLLTAEAQQHQDRTAERKVPS